jgi:hypothetical protein
MTCRVGGYLRAFVLDLFVGGWLVNGRLRIFPLLIVAMLGGGSVLCRSVDAAADSGAGWRPMASAGGETGGAAGRQAGGGVLGRLGDPEVFALGRPGNSSASARCVTLENSSSRQSPGSRVGSCGDPEGIDPGRPGRVPTAVSPTPRALREDPESWAVGAPRAGSFLHWLFEALGLRRTP